MEVRRVDLLNWTLRTSLKFTKWGKYQFHQGFWADQRSRNPNHPSPHIYEGKVSKIWNLNDKIWKKNYEVTIFVKLSYTYSQSAPKTPTMPSMLWRTANWSMFKKESLSGNTRFGCCRASKFENERVSQFVAIPFVVLVQQVNYTTFSHQRALIEMCGITSKLTYPNRWIGRVGDQFRGQHGNQIWHLPTIFCGPVWRVWCIVLL